VFVLQRLAALAKQVDLEVASPVPVFPLWNRLRGGLPAPVEEHGGLTVHYPRWFYVPGVLKTLDGRLYARGIRRWFDARCRADRPDLLDAHFVWPDGVAVSHLARRAGLPYVITLRGWLYPCLERPSLRRQARDALLQAAAVISVSSPLADAAADLGVPRERLHVIPNGVDLERFTPVDRREARRQLDLDPDGRLLVAIGHLKPVKGHQELIRAMADLPQDVRLVIVGGDPGRGAHRRRLLDEIERLGLSSRVVLAGRQPYDRVPLYLSAADVSVLPSRREGCPNVVLESLACGTPVVAARVGAVPDLLTPGENGLNVPLRDPGALAHGLRKALDARWSRKAVRETVCERSWEAVAGRVMEVFRGVLGEGASRRPAEDSAHPSNDAEGTSGSR
jgi:glycosyltransferase involved in cell wall biosynthesis